MPLLILIPLVVAVLWLLVIRPYCIRNRKGYTPGANAGVTLWIDWQEATEIARKRGDQRMLLLCRIFLALQILFLALLVILVIAASSF